jgi:two-component system phosphate regulon sensor histidine kinase PhoR
VELRHRILASTLGAGFAAALGSFVVQVVSGGPWMVSLVGLGIGVLASLAVVGASDRGLRRTTRALATLPGEILRAAEPSSPRLLERHQPEAGRIGQAVNAAFDRFRGEVADLERTHRLYRSILEGSPNGVLLCAADGRILSANPAFREMLEVRGDPVGRKPLEVLAVPEVEELRDLAARGLAEGEARSLSGSRFLTLRAIRSPGGEVAILAQDVTRWRMAERARTDFVANVSHELRTPMAAILGYAESLSREATGSGDRAIPAEYVPQIEAIARNSRRLRDTFEGLMHLARVEARAGALVQEPLRLEPLLADAVVDAVDEAGRKGIDIELDCPEDAAASTNAEALGIIVGNLVQNAVKYTLPGGRVWVHVRLVADEVVIEVGDTGIGIDPAHHERIFERFFRVDEGRAREVGGTGLGLAMVKHLALATGARVDVRSTVGQGSLFLVHLAAAVAPP